MGSQGHEDAAWLFFCDVLCSDTCKRTLSDLLS